MFKTKTDNCRFNYRFTDRSLEGVFIRRWDMDRGKWVRINLKEAGDGEFEKWAIDFHGAYNLVFNEAEDAVWSLSERTRVCRWLFEQEILAVPLEYLEYISTLELDVVTQDYLDTYNWYGTLMAIAFHLPEGAEKDRIEMAIAALKPEPSIEEAIDRWGLLKVIESMIYCAEATGHKIECPSEVQEILRNFN